MRGRGEAVGAGADDGDLAVGSGTDGADGNIHRKATGRHAVPAYPTVLAGVGYEFTNAMSSADRRRANLQQLRRFPRGSEGILNHSLPGGPQRSGDGGGSECEPSGDQDNAARRRGKSKQAMPNEGA